MARTLGNTLLRGGIRQLWLALLFVLAANAYLVTAAAEPFAALTITATGRQLFDITSGVTTLPDGGVVTDQATGVSLTATYIEYVEGRFVSAEMVEVTGEFGTVTAPELYLDLEEGILEAGGGLDLQRDGLSMRAEALVYDANRQIAAFSGGVIASGPTFESDRLYLDVNSGDVLLDGRYVYEDALFTMESPEEGGQLELRFSLRDGQPSYDAATEVRPEFIARFEGYL